MSLILRQGSERCEKSSCPWPTADADPAATRTTVEFASIWRDKAADVITMLRLVDSRAFGNGVVMPHYVR